MLTGTTVFAQAQKFAVLKEKGLITEEEYDEKKAVLLDKI